MNYQQALDFLFPRTTTIKFGLERTEQLLRELGDPHRVVPTIHVGGTNGKGSVTALIAAALEAAGWRVGVYTSPHLISFRERVTVAGVPISESAVATWTTRLAPSIAGLGATFFEATTALAFADMAARGAEIAVVEVGLGGRLDSTNVVRPLVSAITKIELDHQRYLGRTLTAIAREKAWIAKPGTPFIVGEPRARLIDVIQGEALAAVRSHDPGGQLDFRVLPGDFAWRGALRLLGRHQRRNAGVAQAVLTALPEVYRPAPEAIAEGFASAFVPGRMDRRGRWFFDVAHNPDGMRALTAAIPELCLPRPIHALVSILGEKAWPEMLVELDRVVDRGVLTVAPTASGRRWNPAWLERWLANPERPPARAQWRLVPDFDRALAEVEEGAGTIVVTGSFHTVGDVMQVKGLGVI